MPAIVSFEDAFIAGLRRLEISQVDVLWLRLDCFRVDRGHHVYAGHLRGCRVHDGRALARLNLLHLGDASVQSRLRNADLGVVEGARFRIPKQFLLARGVFSEVEAGYAWHRRHALGRLVDHLEARIVQRVGSLCPCAAPCCGNQSCCQGGDAAAQSLGSWSRCGSPACFCLSPCGGFHLQRLSCSCSQYASNLR